MRVAFIAHSLVAYRQQLFAAALRQKLQAVDGDLVELYPTDWGRHHREGGWPVHAPGSIVDFAFPRVMFSHLTQWKPNVVLVQQEAYSVAAAQASQWCSENKVPMVLFVWENDADRASGYWKDSAGSVICNADMIICGNSEAEDLVREAGATDTVVLPQVGFDEGLFRPDPTVHVTWDLLFNARSDPMKGEAVLDAAIEGQGWAVAKGRELGYVDYGPLLADRYRSARVTVSPSIDIPKLAREQFAPGVNVESLLTGTPVVTTDQPAIYEWLYGAPGVWFAKQGDPMDLREKLRTVLEGPGRFLGAKAREWAIPKFSNKAVANSYLNVCAKVVR